MRLNRVLQMTAAVSIAMAATVFTISCGEDGSDGKDGGDCTVTGASAPFAVICGGQQVGTLNDGENGANGANGLKGETGANGKSCTVAGSGASWQISCDGENKGTLAGCSIDQSQTNASEVAIGCGETKVNLCNNFTYDPSEKYCSTAGAVALKKECGPNKTPYNADKEYCGFENKTAFTNKTVKVLAKCVPSGVATVQPNYAEQIFASGSTTELSDPNDSTFYLEGSKNAEWADKYCSVTRTLTKNATSSTAAAAGDSATSIEKGYFKDIPSTKTPAACGTTLSVKFNEGAWKGEYCGFSSGSSNAKTKLSNACGDGSKPDETVFGRTYCQMKNRTDKLTQLAADDGFQFCNKMTVTAEQAASYIDDPNANPMTVRNYAGTGALVTLNEIKSTAANLSKLLEPRDFPDQYCQYTKLNSDSTFKALDPAPTGADASTITDFIFFTRATKGVCGDGSAPDDRSFYFDSLLSHKSTNLKDANPDDVEPKPAWQRQYCQFDATLESKAVGGKDNYCVATPTAQIATESDYLETAYLTTGTRMNETKWNKEFCGYASANAYTSKTRSVIKDDMCSDDEGKPNEAAAVEELGYWPNQYCQASKDGSTMLVGFNTKLEEAAEIAEIAEEAATGTGVTAFADLLEDIDSELLDVYCSKKLEAPSTAPPTVAAYKNYVITHYQATSGVSKLNSKTWQSGGQYCGYSSAQNFGSKTRSVMTGVCGDDKKPNEAKNAPDFWLNEYCQAQSPANDTKLVGIDLDSSQSAVNEPYLYKAKNTERNIFSVFCPADTTTKKAKGTGGSATNFDTTLTNAAFLTKYQSATKLNQNKWGGSGAITGEYCGFGSKANSEKTVPTFSKLTGLCNPATKPTVSVAIGKIGEGGYTGPNQAIGFGGWQNQYCRADDTGATRVSQGTNDYCMPEDKLPNFDTQGNASHRINENTWKGEYCFEDGVRAVCTGGQVAVDNAKSTDTPRCQMPLL